MRNVVLFAKGDLRIEERPMPTLNPRQVLIKLGYGGICGTDMHYYFQGANGAFVVKHPFVLGHEVSGTVVDIGEQVNTLKPGDRVAINPGIPCRQCPNCRIGRENLCVNMRFYGTASTDPHTDGAFSEFLPVELSQCIPLPQDMDLQVAALAEPLAVALHAVNRSGSLMGKSILIAGAGTVGSLIMLAARTMGSKFITVADIMDERLERARACGADHTINVAKEAIRTPQPIDIVFEASGSVQAVNSAITNVCKGGKIVQVGFLPLGELGILANTVMTKELDFIGTFRFGIEFDWAVDYLRTGQIDVKPLITHIYSVNDATTAFGVAADGKQSVKVQLFFPN